MKREKCSLIRYCNICGKIIPHVYPNGESVSPKDYSERRFCSEKCSKDFKESHKKHNPLYKDRLYGVWRGMNERCYCPNHVSYKNYGARGIVVCYEWKNSFENFKKWALENGYDYSKSGKDQTLDRIDNDKGYSPDNCHWVTQSENLRNKRDNVVITRNGISKTATEWGEELGIHPRTIIGRVRSGYAVDDILSTEKFIKRGKTGVKNITFSRGKYVVIINRKYIGSRKTLEEAKELKDKYVAE